MATNKNITMKQFNGTDYDTLYPKTVASQVDGVYSKKETLSDGTKTAYGLDSKAVPDDVFAKIPTFFEPVGTIKTTVRTDLGDKWLLCNGANVDPATYPELCEVLPAADPRADWAVAENFPLSDFEYTTSFDVQYINGYYIAMAKGYTGGIFLYAQSLNGPWTKVAVTTSGNNVYFNKMKYLNGYWVICGYIAYATYPCTIFYATSLSGPWTSKSINSNKNQFITDMIYENGYYIGCGYATGSNADTGMIYYATSLDGTWTSKSVYANEFPTLQTIIYENGYYVTTGPRQSGDAGYVYYTQDFTGTWNRSNAVSNTSSGTTYLYLNDVKYINGKWIVCGSTSSGNYSRVFVADTLSGAWTCVFRDPDSTGKNLLSFIYADGLYIFRFSNGLYITDDLESMNTNYSTVTFDTAIASIACNDGYYFAGGTESSGFYLNTKYRLPTITTNRSYTYIKAKE